MSRLEASVQISKAVGEVFAYVIDPTHTPDWMHAVLAVTMQSEKPVEVGTTFQHRWQLLDRLLDTTYEVLECEPSRSFTYQSIVSLVPRLVCLRLERTAGGTRLTCCIEQDLSPLIEQDAALVGPTVQQHLESDLLCLKKVLESR
jgi:uncharacterized protein YndB with AHSA1/START domain